MDNTMDAHIFKRRNIGDREEVRIKLFDTEGSPIEVGGALEVAFAHFKTVDDPSESQHNMRTESDGFTIYSGTWERVSESAAEEEGAWYVGSIRPPGPGIYLLVGKILFGDNSLNTIPIRVSFSSEGSLSSIQELGYNEATRQFGGVEPVIYAANFSVMMRVPEQGDSYLYANLETESGESFEGSSMPTIMVFIARLTAL